MQWQVQQDAKQRTCTERPTQTKKGKRYVAQGQAQRGQNTSTTVRKSNKAGHEVAGYEVAEEHRKTPRDATPEKMSQHCKEQSSRGRSTGPDTKHEV